MLTIIRFITKLNSHHTTNLQNHFYFLLLTYPLYQTYIEEKKNHKSSLFFFPILTETLFHILENLKSFSFHHIFQVFVQNLCLKKHK